MASFLDQQFDDSESEGEDFNPQAYESEDEDVRAPKQRRDKVKSRAVASDASDDDNKADGVGEDDDVDNRGEEDAAGDEDDAEDVDEDEDDEDEDDDEDERPRKRLKNRRRMQFIDEEAEVEDEDEEEELDDDDIIGDERHPDDDAELAVADHDDRRHRELDRARERAEEMDAEKQAELLRQRYGRQRAVVADTSGIPQHLLLPSVDDPSIWAVRCRIGKEADVVNAIMKRFAERLGTPDALQISSCFTRGGVMAGYVYIEARRQPAVLAATENVTNCYNNNISLIHLNEMPDLLRVRKPKELKPGQYVRMKRPALYAGDLALIDQVESNASEVTVKLVPRLDYTEDDSRSEKRKRPGGQIYRPPARHFNAEAARKANGRYFQHHGKRAYTVRGEEYEDGFLIKTVKFNAIETDNVNPTLEEASKFAASTEDGEEQSKELDLAQLAATIKQSSLLDDYLPGDMVEVFQGEQKGVKGKTIAVHSEIVTFQVAEGVLKGQKIEAPTKTLRKVFRDGDAVKVLANSKYHGESGLVLKVQDDKVTLLTDANRQEITVFSRDLRAAQDSSAPVGVSKYDLFDIVRLDASTVGCVVKVDRETIRVLDQTGNVRTMLPSNISEKLDKKRPTIATDRDGTEIHVGDVVRESGGQQKTGEAIYIYRTHIFLLNRQILQNAGIFVARGNGVVVQSAKGARPIDAPDFTKLNPALRQGPGGPNNTMAPPPRNSGGDRLEGREVLVYKGPSKGLKGRIRDATSSFVRIEFHTKGGLHPFKRDVLKIKDPNSDNYYPIGGGPGRRPGGSAGAPGGLASRVPMGARTPMGAGMNGGGRTPAWSGGADGGKTPAWRSGGDGGKTPAWNSSSARTPAWQADGSRTVAHWSNDGSRTAYGGGDYNGGSKTPAYYANSAPTPGASGGWGANAATPAALDAPTPGANYLAATPAAFDAPTPRNPYSYGTPAATAPTPGAFADTPGYSAATPAAIDDDEPRYD